MDLRYKLASEKILFRIKKFFVRASEIYCRLKRSVVAECEFPGAMTGHTNKSGT